jgi:cytochrome bd-type quinol oxidase subunit 1
LATAIIFTLLYGVLMAADVYLLAKYAKADTQDVANDLVPTWA